MTNKKALYTLGAALAAIAIFTALPSPAVTLTAPQTYTCNGGDIAGITIRNTHDVTVKDCNVKTSTRNGIQITDSYNVTLKNVTVNSTYPEGSGINLEATSAGATHDVIIEDFHIYGNMGWGIVGSYQALKNITVRNGLIEDVGQSGGMQKHGFYINNWQDSIIEDVTVLRSWNSGIKIVGATTNLKINRITIYDSGRNATTTSGPGISLDDARITGLVISNCDIRRSKSPAIWTLSKVNGATVTGCYFEDNYYAVEIPSGGAGWIVTHNVGFNHKAYTYARPPLQLDGGGADAANNFFDYNNWWYEGSNPIRLSSVTYSLAQWQARGADLHSVSAPVGTTPNTPIPASPTPTPTFTVTAISTVQISQTPTSVPPTRTPVLPSPTGTPVPTLTPVCYPVSVGGELIGAFCP